MQWQQCATKEYASQVQEGDGNAVYAAESQLADPELLLADLLGRRFCRTSPCGERTPGQQLRQTVSGQRRGRAGLGGPSAASVRLRGKHNHTICVAVDAAV